VKKRHGESARSDRADEPGIDTDTDRFAREMADVVPLAPDPRGRVRSAPVAAPPRAIPAASQDDTPDNSDAGGDFVASGVDRREIRKLKRGDYVPGRRLDLHGATAVEAVASVKRFIDNGRRTHRCVCIVHGRGLHSEGNVAVLRTRVRECLRQNRSVLAYADAPRTDGGSGAVYVLLRR
jgi:DNA-nicking Smr family endonuclease